MQRAGCQQGAQGGVPAHWLPARHLAPAGRRPALPGAAQELHGETGQLQPEIGGGPASLLLSCHVPRLSRFCCPNTWQGFSKANTGASPE